MAKITQCPISKERVARLLRSRSTQRYFNIQGWTEDPGEATSFSDLIEAAQACNQYGLIDVELAVRLRADSCDIFTTTLQ